MAQNLRDDDIGQIMDQLADVSDLLTNKSVLITGANGFLGRYMTAFLSELALQGRGPSKIIAMDNQLIAHQKYDGLLNVTYVHHDVIQPIPDGLHADLIIHAAGVASPQYYRKFPLETIDVAVTGTRNMLDAAKKWTARILFFSSSEIYGDPRPEDIPIKEDYRGNVSCNGPRACYDESKRLGETLCKIYHEQFSVGSVVVRPFNVFGPGMHQNDFRVIPSFINNALNDSPIRVYSTGNQTRTYCYATDAIAGFIRALLIGTPGEAYNIGNIGPEISLLELVRVIETALGKSLRITHQDYPDTYPGDEPRRRQPDISKATAHLRYEPKISLREGLDRFIEWANVTYTRPC